MRSRRTPRASFFTVVFPLILLALLNSTGSGNTVSVPGGKVDFAQYYTPSIGVYALAVSCYVAPIFGLASARELGILKRVRGTPLSPWIYVAAWLAATIIVGLAAMTLMIIVSVPAFGFHIYPRLLPAAFVTAVLGATALCAIGFAVATFVRRADTAPAIANLTLFPILFSPGVLSARRRTGAGAHRRERLSAVPHRPSLHGLLQPVHTGERVRAFATSPRSRCGARSA